MARSKSKSKQRTTPQKSGGSRTALALLGAEVPVSDAVLSVAEPLVETTEVASSVAIEEILQPPIASSVSIGESCLAQIEAIAATLREQTDRHDAQIRELNQQQLELRTRSVQCEAAEVRLNFSGQVQRERARKLRRLLERLKKLRDRTAAQRCRLKQLVQQRLADSVPRSEFVRQTLELAAALSSNEELGQQAEVATRQCDELKDQLSADQQTIQRLQAAIESIDVSDTQSAELEAARAESKELRWQVNDMAAKLASSEVRRADSSGRVSQETMTWDQRKAMMLARLTEEDSDTPAGDDDASTVIERDNLRSMIEKSDHELRRKDHEIEELRNLLQEQSNSSNGIVIGAAAFAQMFDSDEMICQEREKLREMQQQWEDKLRKAEIELSLERARLARERSEVEQQAEVLREQIQELKQQVASPPGQGKRVPVRRWLAQLGLGDEG